MARTQRKEEAKAARARGKEALKVARAHWATPTGRAEAALICAGLPTRGIEVILFEESKSPPLGEAHVPGQMVAVDHVNGCVVVALRGSSCLRDALLDLDCKPELLSLGGMAGQAHAGMLRSARRLNQPLAAAVELGLAKLGGAPRVVLCGHSLGAGVAALLAALWTDSDTFAGVDVECLAFACPQVFDAGLAEAMRPHTTSFILGDDCVPCLGLASAIELRDALIRVQKPADPDSPGALGLSEITEAARSYDIEQLVAIHADIRQSVGSSTPRLVPPGYLVRLAPGYRPVATSRATLDELVLHKDMVFAHLPRRYLAAVQEAQASFQGRCNSQAPIRSSL